MTTKNDSSAVQAAMDINLAAAVNRVFGPDAQRDDRKKASDATVAQSVARLMGGMGQPAGESPADMVETMRMKPELIVKAMMLLEAGVSLIGYRDNGRGTRLGDKQLQEALAQWWPQAQTLLEDVSKATTERRTGTRRGG